MYAYVFADSATIDAPVRIPVRSVARSFFTFMATLFSTTCELLSIGDLTVHERAPSPQRTARATAGTYPSCQRCCAASASHSGKTKGGGSPLHTSPRPPLQ